MHSHTQLGILLLPSHPTRRVIELAMLAEHCQFDNVWIPDERFFRDPYQLLSLLGHVTRRVQLGPCVTDPYSRHPTLTAIAIATLDEVSDGRAVLGIGAGISGFEELGIARIPPPVPATRQAIASIREHLLSAPRRAGSLGLDFPPARRRVPIYVAAEGPAMLKLAGSVADGVFLQAKVAPALFSAAVATVRAASTAADNSGLRIVARVDVSLSDRISEAYDALRPRVARRLIASAPDFAPFRVAGLTVAPSLRASVKDIGYTNDHRVLARVGRHIPDEFVDAFCVASTPGGLAIRLDTIVDIGADQVVVHPVPTRAGRPEEVIEAAGAWHAAHLR